MNKLENRFLDLIEVALCRSIGCTGPLSRFEWFGCAWGHRFVCTPFTGWRFDLPSAEEMRKRDG